MKQRIVKRNTNKNLNLTPLYKENIFGDGGSPFDNISSASIGDAGTTAAMQGGGSVGGTFASLEGMFDAGLSNAKLKSTYNIQSDIADNMSLAFGNNMNTNDELMEAWDDYNPMSHISRKDVRGGSTLGRIWNTNMASIKGAEAGWNASKSPYGAIIGGVIGLGTGIAGWITGGKKASRIRDKLNREIDIANAMGYQTLANQTADVAQKNLMRAEGNYVAEGGELNAGLDKRFAGTLMQDIYGNGIPSQNKFAPGGNVNIALGQNPEQTQGGFQYKSRIESLMPFIMMAKEQRERKEALELQKAEAERQARIQSKTQQEYAEALARIQAQFAAQAQTQPAVQQPQVKSAYYTDPSEELYTSVMNFEGFLPKPEWDVDGYAIGYGDHNKELVEYYRSHPEESYSKEEGSKLVKKTVGEVRKILSENIPNWNELTGPQQDALTSYGYNTGPWAIINHSPSLMKALADKDWKRAAKHINRGWYQRDERGRELLGLRKRRNFERLPFLYPEMTTYGVLPDGTVVNPDDLLKVDLSKPYSFENGVWKNTSEFAEDNNGTVPVFVSNAFGGNLFPNGGTVDKYTAAGRRYRAARNALLNRGYSSEDATRLARILATQAIAETGYRDFDDNNYGGHLYPGTRTRIKFDSEEDYWNKHIDNLDKKWPTWNTANSLDSYYDIINHTDLGLKTEADYNAYKKSHKDSIYLYAPEWENKNYRENLNAIYPRASKYYKEELVAPQFIRAQEPVNTELPSWNNLHFGFGGNLFAYGTEGDPPEGVKTFQQTMQKMQAKKNINNLIEQAKINKERKESAEAKVKAAIDKRKKSSRGFTDVTGGVGYDAIDNIIEDAATYGKELGLENEYRNAAAKRAGVAALTALTVPASFGAFGAVPAAGADSYFMAEAAHNIKNNTAGPMDYAMLAIPAAKAMYPVAKFQEAFNVGPKSTNYVEKPVIKITKNDPFIKRLEEVTNKTITKKPIKETNIGDVYSEGIGYYDEFGNQIAHIAGNKKPGNKVFIESSYIDPAYRHQGLGTQMYKNFNEFIYDKYGTTLHSSPYQHMSTVETSPGSGVFISPSSKMWRAFKNKGEATIEGQGLNHYYVMEKPTKTDIQWDSAFNKALEEGNTKEAERLFNLHRQVKGYSNNNEYHSTDNPYFTVFDINHSSKDGIPDPFIHTGTKEAARQRGGKRMLKLNAKYNNLLKTYDGIQDSPMDIINEIDKVKNIPIKEKQDLYKKWRETISKTHYDDQHIAKQKLVKELLEKYGFDGIEYINKGEDVGSVSRGFIGPEQLKLSNIITYDDAGNMIPLSKRHDFNNPDIRYGLIPIGLGIGLGIGLNTKTKKK